MNNASHALGDYKVGKRIANGGFGFVYSGKASDGTKVAIKYERTYTRVKRPYLQHEADVVRLLQGDPCVPTVYAYGREERWNIMVFDLLGTSLETLFEKCGEKFSLKTTLMLAPQIIECIEYCHSKGIIHRDIKPDNFLMGRGDRANFVHIIDFGLARRFRHPKTLEHFPYFEGHNFFGTTRFASLKTLEGCSQSRRDDLESAAYSLIYFMRGRLPWQGLRGGTDRHRDQRVREKKRTWTPERLCEGLPVELAKMLEYVKSLSYTDEPDYAYLKSLFRDRFDKEGFELDYDYDWLHVTDEENETSDEGSLSGSEGVSKANKSADDKFSVDSGESNGPAVNDTHSTASKGVFISVRDESEDSRTDSDISPLSPVDAISKGKGVMRSSTASNSAASSSEKSGPSGSSDPKSSKSKSDDSHQSLSSASKESSSSQSSIESPIKKGDFVLIKMLARPTLEKDGSFDSSAPVDNSYWHNPSLSEDDWHFPYRPALVTNVNAGQAYTRLYVLPIMQRSNGLEDVSPMRRPAFFQIRTGEAGPSSGQGEGGALIVEPKPAWPRDGTYVYHQYDMFRILVPADDTKNIDVVWRLDKEQLKRLLRARDDVMEVVTNDNYLSDAGSETEEVRMRQRRRRSIVHYPVYGDIASLTEDALARPDVDLEGSNGWLREFFKVDRRRNHENGYYTDDSDCSVDDENVSMYTGPAPGNRRLSCTLAIDGDVILEAASTAGSDRDSVASSSYRSSYGSRASSYRSKGSSRRSKGSPRRSKADSAVKSIAGSVHSLRHAVLDSAARSARNSPTCSTYGSVAGSSRTSSDAGSVAGSSHASFDVTSSSDSSHVSFEPASAEGTSRASSDAGSSASSSRASSDASSIASSIVGSAAGSVASFAMSVAESLIGSDAGGYNREASAAEGKVMVDESIQTEGQIGIHSNKN